MWVRALHEVNRVGRFSRWDDRVWVLYWTQMSLCLMFPREGFFLPPHWWPLTLEKESKRTWRQIYDKILSPSFKDRAVPALVHLLLMSSFIFLLFLFYLFDLLHIFHPIFLTNFFFLAVSKLWGPFPVVFLLQCMQNGQLGQGRSSAITFIFTLNYIIEVVFIVACRQNIKIEILNVVYDNKIS